MERKRIWLSANESVGYGHPKSNQVQSEENDNVYLELDKKHKTSHDFDHNNWVKC